MDKYLEETAAIETAKYPSEVLRSIVELGPVGWTSGGYTRSSTPRAQCRSAKLSCGHSHRDLGSPRLPARAVGDVVPCVHCGEFDGLGIEASLRQLAARTRAPWAPLISGLVSAEAWARIKPLLRAELVDDRIDEVFAAYVGWERVPYEPARTEQARRLELLPGIIRAVMRDPVQETASSAPARPRRQKGAK